MQGQFWCERCEQPTAIADVQRDRVVYICQVCHHERVVLREQAA